MENGFSQFRDGGDPNLVVIVKRLFGEATHMVPRTRIKSSKSKDPDQRAPNPTLGMITRKKL